MARFTAAVLVVGATLLLPSTLALDLQASSTPLSLGIAGDALALTQTVGPPVGTVTGALDAPVRTATRTVLDLAACRDAVQLTLVGWGGRGSDVVPGQAAFLLPWTETEAVTQRLPVYETETEVTRTLFGLLPQTREVTRLVGYESVTTTVSQTFDLAVLADWTSEYVDWQRVTETVLVTLPVGLPLAAIGQGTLVKVCDPSTPVLSFVPDQDTSGFDYWSPFEMEDGWYIRLLTLDVHLASAQELAELPQGDGWMLCPTDVMRAVSTEASALGLRPSAASAPPATDALPEDPAASQLGESGMSPASASLALGAMAAPAAGALAVLAALVAGAVAWRRLR